ncbi:MAG TPA: histidine kinase, partial [candidate division Zixibacteria bacterium]|nr:histidine kinase [candidate division Zixibacteria bacterium]
AKLIAWNLWGLVTLGVLRLAAVIPLQRGRAWRWVVAHLALSVPITILYIFVYNFIMMLFYDVPNSWANYWNLFGPVTTKNQSYHYLAYWVALGVDLIVRYSQSLREKEVRAAELERQLADARLEALKAQLQPHFLFNTLNLIAELIHSDPELADRTLERLSDLLRMSLKHADTQETTLYEELRLVQVYLEIQQSRFSDRLSVVMDTPPDLERARTPSLVLQPLVENAIRHGVAQRSEPTCISISARQHNGSLELRVEDNGPGIDSPDHSSAGHGLGLQNTRERLARLYGPTGTVELMNRPSGGVCALVRIPLRLSDPTDAAER